MKARIIGFFLLFEALFMLVSSLVALFYFYRCGDGDVLALTVSTIITAISGFVLISAGRKNGKPNKKDIDNFEVKDSFLIVTLTWVVFAIFGMLPFLLNGTVSTLSVFCCINSNCHTPFSTSTMLFFFSRNDFCKGNFYGFFIAVRVETER